MYKVAWNILSLSVLEQKNNPPPRATHSNNIFGEILLWKSCQLLQSYLYQKQPPLYFSLIKQTNLT